MSVVVNAFLKSAYLNRRLNLHLGGRMWRPLIHINDVAEGYIASLRAKKEVVCGQVINLLSTNLTVKQVAKEVRNTLEKNKNIHIDLDLQEVGIARSYRVDDSLCKELLSFSPKSGETQSTSPLQIASIPQSSNGSALSYCSFPFKSI